jgi:tetratricopeptide (TPR) repeat protein
MPVRSDLWVAWASDILDRRAPATDTGTLEAAKDMLEAALRFNRSDAFAWSRLGRVETAMPGATVASTASPFERALALAPHHAPFWIQDGFRCLQFGEPAEALKRFITATDLEPFAPVGYLGAGLARAQLGDAEGAKRSVETCLALLREHGAVAGASDYNAFLFSVDEAKTTALLQELQAAAKAPAHPA